MNIFLFIFLSQTALNFYFRNPLNSLYFLHRGFLDVSQGEGITGASYNPAALHFGSKNEITVFGSSGYKTYIDFNIPIGIDSVNGTEVPKIVVPFNFSLEDRGGMDFIGAKTKIGAFDIGISYYTEDVIGMDLILDFSQQINNLTLNIKDTLSREDHPDIPSGTEIPVNITLKGDLNFSLSGNGGIEASVKPISLGAAIGFGPVAIGAGLNIKRYKGNVNLKYDIFGGSQGLSLYFDSLVVDNQGDTWNVDLNINGNLNQKLFEDKIFGGFSGTQIGLLLGTKIQVPLITAGLAIEYSLPFTISGSISGTYEYIDGIQSYVIDTNQVNIDTVTNTITGDVVIDSIEFYYSTQKYEILKTSLNFPGILGVKAGINLNLIAFNFNLAGGIDIPSGNYCFGKAYFMLATGFGAGPFHANLGSVFSWRYLKYKDFYLFTPPNVTLGIGGNISFPYFSIYLGARAQPLAGVLSGIKKIGGQGKITLNPLKASAFNFGIKIKI